MATPVAEMPQPAELAVVGPELTVRMPAVRGRSRLPASEVRDLGRAGALDRGQVAVHERSKVGEHAASVALARAT